MSTSLRVSLLAAGALLWGSADAAAQVWGRVQTPVQTPRNGVCFYDDIHYGGQYFCTNSNTENPMVELNDRISSIRVFGNAEVTVYQDRDFQGRSQTIAADISDLRRDGWSDTITSVRVQPQGTGAWTDRWGRPAVPVNGACFYENVDFGGQYFCSRQGERVEMVPEGTNDRISSIRLFGNAEIVVFRDRDFGGAYQWFDVSEPDLRESGWNDTISSYEIGMRATVGNRGRGFGFGRGAGRFGSAEPAIGTMEWRGRVDNRLQLLIRGRSVEERTMAGTTLEPGRAIFGSGLPTEPVRITVRQLAGRGTVSVVQQPSRMNGFTAIVEITDPGRGAQEHRLAVTWR